MTSWHRPRWKARHPRTSASRALWAAVAVLATSLLGFFAPPRAVASVRSASTRDETFASIDGQASSLLATADTAPIVTWSGVLRTASGQPVPGVSMRLYGPGGGSSSTVTSSAGAFSLSATAGEDELTVTTEGEPASVLEELGLPVELHSRTPLDLAHDTESDVTLPKVVTVGVTVKDSLGHVVEGAFVTAAGVSSDELAPGVEAEWKFSSGRVATNSEGLAATRVFATSAAYANATFEPEGASGGVENIDALADTTATITLNAPTLVTLSGVLKTASGQPVPGVALWLLGSGGGSNVSVTSSAGAFSIQAAPGEQQLRVQYDDQGESEELGLPTEFSAHTEIDLTHDTELDVTLPEVVTIGVTVQDTLGHAVEGASVGSSGKSPNEFAPGIDGEWSFSSYGVLSNGEGHGSTYAFATSDASASAGIETDGVSRGHSVEGIDALTDTTATITLPALVTWTGVLKTASGQPVSGVSMRLSGPGGGSSSTVTSSDGAFALAATPGEDRLTVASQDQAESEELGLPSEFSAHPELDLTHDLAFDLTLPEVVTIALTVQDTLGAAVEGASVSTSGKSPGEFAPGIDGEWKFSSYGVLSNSEGHASNYAFATPEASAQANIETDGVARSAYAENIDALADTNVTLTLPTLVPAPTIKKLSTKHGPAAGSTAVTITGANFTHVAAVKFGGVNAASFTVDSETKITAVSPPGTAGPAEVSVTTPAGESASTDKARFVYGPPTVTEVSPDVGPKSGGMTIVVSGSGFAPGSDKTTFEFGNWTSPASICASTTECSVVTPVAARSRTVDVKATAGGETSRKNAPADEYSYE